MSDSIPAFIYSAFTEACAVRKAQLHSFEVTQPVAAAQLNAVFCDDDAANKEYKSEDDMFGHKSNISASHLMKLIISMP